MALSPTLCDREMDKFTTDTSGDTCVRTCGESVPSGLGTAWRVTTLDVGTTATLLPATALTNRNHFFVQNLDATATLYLGPTSGVTADAVNGTTSGAELSPGDQFHVDITDGISVYGIVSSGTIKVKVVEFS